MSRNAQMFDIDTSVLQGLRDALGATQGQMLDAYARALKRTTKYLHRMSVAMVLDELAVKKRSTVLRRVKPFIKQRNRSAESSGELSKAKIWYGLSSFRVSELKGSLKGPRKKAQKRDEKGRFVKGKGGGSSIFRPKGKGLSAQTYPNAFVAERYGRRSVWIRTGTGITEARVDVAEPVEDAIDDYIFDNIGEIFMRYYEQDLRGRVAGNVGVGKRG